MNQKDVDALVTQTLIVKGQFEELKARANAVSKNMYEVERKVVAACETASNEHDIAALVSLLELREWLGAALKMTNRLLVGNTRGTR